MWWCSAFLLILISGNLVVAGHVPTFDTWIDFPAGDTSNKELSYFRVNLNNETRLRGLKMPCQCFEEECGCCSGNILQNFNINIRQHFCINMTYEPEDLSLGVKMSINDLVLLSSKVSGRNPPPLCINIPRIKIIRFCGKFTNVYLIGRNIHACITVETEWNNRTVFSYNFDCVRLGLNGVAIIPPEAGGGLPQPINEEVDDIEEYDELLENQSTSTTTTKATTTKKKKTKVTTTKATTAATATATAPTPTLTSTTATKPVKKDRTTKKPKQ